MSFPVHVGSRQIRSLVLLLVLLPFVPAIFNFRFMAEVSHNEKEAVLERFTTLYSSHLEAVTGLLDRQMRAETNFNSSKVLELLRAGELQTRRMDGIAVVQDGKLIGWTGGPDTFELPDTRNDAFPAEAWIPLPINKTWYFIQRTEGVTTVYFLRKSITLGRDISGFYQTAFGVEPLIRLESPEGRFFPPQTSGGEIMLSKVLGGMMSGWKISLIVPPASAVAGGSSEQISSYQRLGLALVAVILAISMLAGYAVSRQIRFNEMQLDGIAVIAHELKTPLAAIRLLLETLSSGRLKTSEENEEYLEMAGKENARLSRVVNGMLALGRIKSRDYKPRLQFVRAADFVQMAIEAVEVRVHEMDFDLCVSNTAPDQELMADEEAMSTALVNLLENAMKYSGENRRIEVDCAVEESWWVLRVKDCGIGIPRSELKRIFRPFYQVDSRLSRRTEGTGLGMSIVQRIVRSHSGHVEVVSEPGRGSTFTIRLPLP